MKAYRFYRLSRSRDVKWPYPFTGVRPFYIGTMREKKYCEKLKPLHIALLVVLPVICAAACLCVGRMALTLREVLSALLGGENCAVVRSMRLPRILLAGLVGAGLSVSGCVFQSMFSNPLATPDTLGVASGASFGAALALLMGFKLVGVQITAFVFGAAAIALTWLAGLGRRSEKNTMILSGIMIGSLFSALVSLVKYTADTESELPAITYWLMGSLASAGYGSLRFGAPVIGACLLTVFCLRWRLDLLPLSDDEARTLGVNIRALRCVLAVCAAAMTASCVAMCGQVGWVGLLVPHVCRMRFGSRHARLVPACVSLGAAFMMLVDTAARSLTAAEIPISVLTAVVGAPFFIIMLRRSGGWEL